MMGELSLAARQNQEDRYRRKARAALRWVQNKTIATGVWWTVEELAQGLLLSLDRINEQEITIEALQKHNAIMRARMNPTEVDDG
jgi:hypothetical protein